MKAKTKELPTSWRRVQLAEVCDIILGQSPPGSTYNSEGIGPPFFQGKAEFGNYYPTPVKWCSAPAKIAEPEDVLISVRAPVGPTNLCPSRACIGRGLAAIRTRQGMPSRYLLYALRATVGALVEKSTGSTFEAINGSDLRSHVIPLPPLDEQLQIVAEIEKQFTRLEAGMAALKRVQANLKRYRAAILKAACEGRLVPTEADLARKEGRSYETGDQLLARILTERRRNWRGRGKYKEPVSPDTTNLPPLPEGWTWASVGQLGEIKGGKRLPMGHEYSPTPTAFPYIRVVDFEHYGVSQDELKFLCDETQKEIQRYTISKNDVYISIAGSIGVVGVVPDNLDGANLTENAAKITSLSFVEKKYICFWLSSNAGRSFVADKTIATTQPKLALFRIEVIPISLPPLAEQSRIVAEVERRLSVIEEQEAAVSTSLQRAARLRQSILQRAFSGGLVYNGT